MRNFNKTQNLSYTEISKTFSSSEKVLISHDNDTVMEPQETVKKKQSTDNTLRELIFARTYFRGWSNFGDFARANFRE